MLIRSQDKKYLIDMNGLEIHACGREIRASRWVDHYDTIGEYSTEEKAIKVLDMIQEAYETSLYSDHAFDSSAQVMRPYIFVNHRVFQMPSDAEVS